VNELFQEKITDSMDAVGLSDFLPNKNLLSDSGKNKTESLTSSIKSLVSKKKKEDPPKKTVTRGEQEEDIEEQLKGEFGITATGDQGGNGTGQHSGGGDAGGGSAETGGNNKLDDNDPGDLDKKRERKPSKKPVQMQQRYACVDKNDGKYRFMVTPQKSLTSGRLVFKVVGEQSDYDLPIKKAATDNSEVLVEKYTANTIYLQSLKANKSFLLDVEIDYSDYCVMEVELYEN
jgi:hypothetical protein